MSRCACGTSEFQSVQAMFLKRVSKWPTAQCEVRCNWTSCAKVTGGVRVSPSSSNRASRAPQRVIDDFVAQRSARCASSARSAERCARAQHVWQPAGCCAKALFDNPISRPYPGHHPELALRCIFGTVNQHCSFFFTKGHSAEPPTSFQRPRAFTQTLVPSSASDDVRGTFI